MDRRRVRHPFTHTTDWTTFNLEPPAKPVSYQNDSIPADPKSFSEEHIVIGFLSMLYQHGKVSRDEKL
jgi:hypothetical protein